MRTIRRWLTFAFTLAALTAAAAQRPSPSPLAVGPQDGPPGSARASAVTPADEPTTHTPPLLPGMQVDGRMLLPNGWTLDPAGRHIPIGDLPLAMEFSPDRKYLAIVHAGFGPHEAMIARLGKTTEIVSSARVPNSWYGLAWNADGTRLYVSGGQDDLLHEFAVREGKLGTRRDISLRKRGNLFMPGGLALSRDGKRIYTANNRHHSVAIVPLVAEGPARGAEPGVELIPLPDDSFPYACILSPDEKSLYVSLWGKAQVAEIDLAARRVRRTIHVDQHPNEMLLSRDGKTLFVACANENTVALIECASGGVRKKLSSALYPGAPEGSTPNSIALSGDGETLYVANADNNNLAVFEVEPDGRTKSRGFIPVGWYPTSVRVAPDTGVIYVANAKGMSSRANPRGPKPGQPKQGPVQYIAAMFKGTLSTIQPADDERLANLSRRAYACSPFRGMDALTSATLAAPNPVPARPGETSPIQYVVYIIKENRTYDQILGDLPRGNGDPRLCLFPRRVTPNHHAFAEEFVLFDNFYVEAEVSADGHQWSTAAYATDFVEKHWPMSYGHKKASWDNGYSDKGGFRGIVRPAAGYIWDQCAKAGVTYRSYGEFVNNGKTRKDPAKAAVKSLEGHIDPWYRGFDVRYSDQDRATQFIKDFRELAKSGDIPRFIMIRLPNDHTAGTKKDHHTPEAMLADNDLAFGRIVEELSHSRFWPKMAIFVLEDDAQNGSDHVDAHRSPAFIISPWVKRGSVDSTLYSTSSMLRTMELILGLQPMSQFDAGATPMRAAFTMTPDLRPWKALPANVDLRLKNSAGAPGQKETEEMNLEVEDAIDDVGFNVIIWKAVRGAESEMPAPVHAAFVFQPAGGDGDDDDD